jgi:hypothetical protein
MSASGAIFHCRVAQKKFKMWPAYACLLNDIREKTNRTRLIAACKRSLRGIRMEGLWCNSCADLTLNKIVKAQCTC